MSLDVLSAFIKVIVTVKAGLLCLAHAVIISISQVNGETMYKLYSDGKGL
jgi:hypothetical protein